MENSWYKNDQFKNETLVNLDLNETNIVDLLCDSLGSREIASK